MSGQSFIVYSFISVFLIFVAFGLYGFFRTLTHQYLMIIHRNKDVKFFDKRLFFNIANIQFFGAKYLTEKGVYHRNKSWHYLKKFCLSLIVLLCCSFILVALKK